MKSASDEKIGKDTRVSDGGRNEEATSRPRKTQRRSRLAWMKRRRLLLYVHCTSDEPGCPILFLKKRYVISNVADNVAKQKTRKKSSFVTFRVAKHESSDGKGLLDTWCPGWTRYLIRKVDSIKIVSYDFLEYYTASMFSGPRNL
ncbi:hypothetical protein TSAR_006064 [Trichomalopsis sarcophagae]|uniref:Uncharacterized protein n=1 Tax=Trichomalopsis sarcophagae TaxID=543379 RepID=A0A232EZU2_9HYME|nr:hypothetical protein TSAR_006064 [Trichomalopsis sarcophagae]